MANLNGKNVATVNVVIRYDATGSVPTLKITNKASGNAIEIDPRLLADADSDLYAKLVDPSYDEYEESNVIDSLQVETLKQIRREMNAGTVAKVEKVEKSAPVNPVTGKPAPAKKTAEQMIEEPVVILPEQEARKVKTAGSSEQAERIVSRMVGRDGTVSSLDGEVKKVQAGLNMLRYMDKVTISRFNYYIPYELSVSWKGQGPNGEDIPIRIHNPAKILRRLGAVHLDGSNWIVTDKMMENAEVCEFVAEIERYADYRGTEDRGPESWLDELTQKQKEDLKSRIRDRITHRIRSLGKSLLQNVFSADERLQKAREMFEQRIAEGKDAPTEKEEQRAQDKRNDEVRKAIKEAAADLNAAFLSAEVFEVQGEDGVAELFAGVKSAILAQEQAFNLLVEEIGIQRGKFPKGSNVSLNV